MEHPLSLQSASNRARRVELAQRRNFLIAGAGGLAALFSPLAGALPSPARSPWAVLEAVQEHLFPRSENAPGAHEIHALAYLKAVLADPRGDRDEQRFILKGVEWLESLSQQRFKASFLVLDTQQREQILLEVAATPKGDNWLSTLLLYLCEALLCDPAYGGNPGGIGWQWLAHQPGFPRPPPDKRYGARK